jgi:type I restriction enzyme S subunit
MSDNAIYINKEYFTLIKRSHIRPGYFLFSIMASVGNVAVVPNNFSICTANRAVGILVPKESNPVLPYYLLGLFSTKFGLRLLSQLKKGGLQKRVNLKDIEQLMIPLPPFKIQQKLVTEFEAGRELHKKKLKQAEELLGSLDVWLLEKVGIKTQTPDTRTVFALRLKQIDGVINVERYAKLPLQKMISGTTVGELCEIIKEKTIPAKDAPEIEWDRIRIDDLPNQPLQLEKIETSYGKDIQGSFFLVQENDILLARLGPTIQNSKFVLCPPLRRQTIASSEFLVIRCNKGWNPEVVLWILRTKLFRDIMYSKCTGGTPSRYRLSAENLIKITFPIISRATQQIIATEIRKRLDNIRRLRTEAAAEWVAAKARFEAQLLGK